MGDSQGTVSYAYDEAGNQSHLYNPNGTRVDQHYNPDGTPHNYYNWNGGSVVFSSYGYGYNADHQITGMNEGTTTNTDDKPGPTQSTYVYDGLGHLSSESRTGSNPYSTAYAVDGVGNRTNYYDGSNSPFNYDIDDEVKTITGASAFSFGYNANGDRTSETVSGQLTTFGYDFDDQLTSLTKSGTSEGFSYDAIGRQLSKTVNGGLTIYYFDGSQVVEEKTSGGTLLAQYLWGNGLARCNGEFPLSDGRGNVRQSMNAGQQIISANAPTAFGIGSVTGGTASAYSYGAGSGYRQDGIAPAGLPSSYAFQKVGARYYDPAVGAFLTRDTDLSQSPYAYCYSDPINFVDLTGHEPVLNKDQSLAVIAIGVGVAAIGVALLAVPAAAVAIPLAVAYGVILGGAFIFGVGSGAFGRNIYDQFHEPVDRPEKAGGPSVGGGDTSITNGEEAGLEAEQNPSQASPSPTYTQTFKVTLQNEVITLTPMGPPSRSN